MPKAIKLRVSKVWGMKTPMFDVFANDVHVGLVEQATISLTGEPEYIVHYYDMSYPGHPRVTHDVVYSGPFGNVEAVAFLLDRMGR